jgi:hypothetical protein
LLNQTWYLLCPTRIIDLVNEWMRANFYSVYADSNYSFQAEGYVVQEPGVGSIPMSSRCIHSLCGKAIAAHYVLCRSNRRLDFE